MLSHQLGFISSWKMLKRDRGWLKPILVIALVSWIPVIGQVVVLGYGLEWARLTAWGVDSAPKQRGIDYKKMLSTGFFAFLFSFIVNVVLGGIAILIWKFLYQQGSSTLGFGDFVSGGLLSMVVGSFFDGGISIVPFVVLFVVNIFIDALVLAMQLRATLYDGFGAGWRVDRIFQMVGRDFTGFFHTALITAVSSTVGAVLNKIVSAAVTAIAITLMMMSFNSVGPSMMMYMQGGSNLLPLILILIIGLIAAYVFQVVKAVLSLISINAMGQWFQRFDVGRWGVSSAPLPDGVPYPEPDDVNDASSNPYAAYENTSTETPSGNPSDSHEGQPGGQPAEEVSSAPSDMTSEVQSSSTEEEGDPVDADPSMEGEGIETEGEDQASARTSSGPILLGPISAGEEGDGASQTNG